MKMLKPEVLARELVESGDRVCQGALTAQSIGSIALRHEPLLATLEPCVREAYLQRLANCMDSHRVH